MIVSRAQIEATQVEHYRAGLEEGIAGTLRLVEGLLPCSDVELRDWVAACRADLDQARAMTAEEFSA